MPREIERIVDRTFWNVIKLGASQQEGIALAAGVQWNIHQHAARRNPGRAALLEPQSDGTLIDATTRLLGNSVTNGAGSSSLPTSTATDSTTWFSPRTMKVPFLQAQHGLDLAARRRFDKLTLADNVMDHDARWSPSMAKRKFLRGPLRQRQQRPGCGFNVIYSWTGNTLTPIPAWETLRNVRPRRRVHGRFRQLADHRRFQRGPGVPYSPTNPMLNYAYKYNAGVLTTPPVLLPKPYFNDKPAFAGFHSFWTRIPRRIPPL